MKFRGLSARLLGNTKKSRRGRNAKRNTPHWQSSSLGLERLETRIALSADPILTVVGDQMVDEGSLLSISNIGVFTDVVESGGATIGLDPTVYQSLGSFNPMSNVTIDTDTLSISGGFSGTGVAVSADVGFGSFDIAVFTFSDFNLDDGYTITATGSLPLALLSQSNLTVAGTIDVSAQSVGGLERIAGPGGGDGGDGNNPDLDLGSRDGYAAAGAPILGVGQLGPGGPLGGGSGSGGGFGGAGGAGEVFGHTTGEGGSAYADLATAIQGGSGGSRSGRDAGGTGPIPVTGGGGGGGIELGAVQTITIDTTGKVYADGGNGRNGAAFIYGTGGGGGAGGGILVHGTNVTQEGLLQANGGDGGGGSHTGGGGGGGEIMLVHSNTGNFFGGGMRNVLGGLGGGAAPSENGQAGNVTIIAQTPVAIPVLETYDFVVNWGDMPPAEDIGAATIDMPGVDIGDIVEGSFDGSHTYADDGAYLVTVTLNDDGGGSDSQSFMVTVNNVAPTLALGGAANTDEGSLYTLNLSSSDPGADSISQWTIDWGDVIEVVAGNPASATHTYADGDANHVITAEATDEDGTYEAGNSVAVMVDNVAPSASVTGDTEGLAGEPLSLMLGATDASSADQTAGFTYKIDWNGDGTVDQTISGADGLPVSHEYDQGGSFTVGVTATDKDGGISAVATHDVTVIQPVEIDVRPGSDSNVVSLMGNGQIAVAIFTTNTFDAAQIDASSVIFAGAFANNSVLEDVDGDGDLDLLLHFSIAETNLLEIYEALLLDDLDEDGVLDSNHQEAEVTLTGETVDQVMIEGMDTLDLFLAGKRLRDLLEELAAEGVL